MTIASCRSTATRPAQANRIRGVVMRKLVVSMFLTLDGLDRRAFTLTHSRTFGTGVLYLTYQPARR
jgi:hypothetical protein